MTPEEAERQIAQAINHLEQGSKSEVDSAYAFLRNIPFTYGVALEAFRDGLKSSSDDARMESAAQLAKLGRRVEWILPVLHEAYVNEQSDWVKGRFAFAIASLKTPEAARVVMELVNQELQVSAETFSYRALCGALGSMGAVACRCLPQIEQSIVALESAATSADATKQHLHGGQLESTSAALRELREARVNIILATQSAYASYLAAGKDSSAKLPVLGRDTLELSSSTQAHAIPCIRLDTRVDFVRRSVVFLDEAGQALPGYSISQISSPHEVRVVLIQRAPSSFVCVAVWDHFSSLSLLNKFESFAQGVISSLHMPDDQTMSLEFGYFQPHSAAEDGGYTGVKLKHEDAGLTVTGWLPAQRFDELFGDQAERIKTLLSTCPPVPEDFMKYLMGQIQDQQAEQRLALEQYNSPEGRLEYSALVSPFCDEVKRVVEQGGDRITKATICGDSFDAPGNEDLFAQFLPIPLIEILATCQRIQEIAIAEGDKDLRYLEWPTLDSLPTELIVQGRRSFEICAEDGANQIVLDLDPQKYGAVFFRVIHKGEHYRVTNIPFTAFSKSSGFNWGYEGAGPSELALNILNAFVPPGADGKPEEESETPYWGVHKRTFVSSTARELAQALYDDMVTKLPVWGGCISPRRLQSWILEQIANR